ncbi:MAG: PspA/IM30 family protein [Armatimonadetes bacterium]|nr:PspA/IM30 family protein [Armatimonadota bacterium]
MGWVLLVLLVLMAAGVVAYLVLRGRPPSGPGAAVGRFTAQLERNLTEAAQAVHRVVSAWKEVRDRVEAREEEARRWGEQARDALLEGDEAVARDRVARQVAAEHAAVALRADLEALAEARQRADRHYEALKQQLDGVRVRYAALAARQAAAGAGESVMDLAAEERRANEAFSQLTEDVAAAEARAAAAAEVSAAGRIYEDPAEIDRRLAALRQPS